MPTKFKTNWPATGEILRSGLIRPRPKFSVIIPVLNEGRRVGKTIQHLRNTIATESTEIIVVDGQSKDQTVIIAQEVADKILSSTHPCRACQMHEGARAATGEILLFLHCDTQLPKNWQASLSKAWSKSKKPSVTAFSSGFDSNKKYYQTLSRMADWRARWITGVPHGDQAIAIERQPYLASGGFPHTPLMEEYYLIRKIRHRGPVEILKERVMTSPRRYEKNGPLLNNLRNLAIISLFYVGISPRTLKKMYR